VAEVGALGRRRQHIHRLGYQRGHGHDLCIRGRPVRSRNGGADREAERVYQVYRPGRRSIREGLRGVMSVLLAIRCAEIPRGEQIWSRRSRTLIENLYCLLRFCDIYFEFECDNYESVQSEQRAMSKMTIFKMSESKAIQCQVHCPPSVSLSVLDEPVTFCKVSSC